MFRYSSTSMFICLSIYWPMHLSVFLSMYQLYVCLCRYVCVYFKTSLYMFSIMHMLSKIIIAIGLFFYFIIKIFLTLYLLNLIKVNVASNFVIFHVFHSSVFGWSRKYGLMIMIWNRNGLLSRDIGHLAWGKKGQDGCELCS
jgi:hypothetical protein